MVNWYKILLYYVDTLQYSHTLLKAACAVIGATLPLIHKFYNYVYDLVLLYNFIKISRYSEAYLATNSLLTFLVEKYQAYSLYFCMIDKPLKCFQFLQKLPKMSNFLNTEAIACCHNIGRSWVQGINVSNQIQWVTLNSQQCSLSYVLTEPQDKLSPWNILKHILITSASILTTEMDKRYNFCQFLRIMGNSNRLIN